LAFPARPSHVDDKGRQLEVISANDFVQLVVAKEIVSVILRFDDTDGAVVSFGKG